MHFAKMMAMVLRYTQDQDRAMIIVNDGFLKVFQKIESFSGAGSLEGWIRRIVFNALSDYFKKENRYLKHLIFEQKDSSTQSRAADMLYYEDLVNLIDEIPFASGEVFRLYAIEGFNHREISEKLGISQGTSKWHLAEARKKLKHLIKSSQLRIDHAG